MKEAEFIEATKELNFTKEEEFKVRQTNELICMIDKLRASMIR